jgi:hypothetical protein
VRCDDTTPKRVYADNRKDASYLYSHLYENSDLPRGTVVISSFDVSPNKRRYTMMVDYFFTKKQDITVIREHLDATVEHWLLAGDIAYVITRFHVVQKDNRAYVASQKKNKKTKIVRLK